ncbi:MAG: helix-turn-helix domain-containing protein [Candidatus Micrarchaeota archaeon]
MDNRLLNEILRLYIFERMSIREVADLLGMSHMTVYRAISDPSLRVMI